MVVFSNNQSDIHLCNNPMYHEKTKHVDAKYHFIRELVATEIVNIKKVLTEDNPTNIGIKALTTAKFKHCLGLLHVEVG